MLCSAGRWDHWCYWASPFAYLWKLSHRPVGWRENVLFLAFVVFCLEATSNVLDTYVKDSVLYRDECAGICTDGVRSMMGPCEWPGRVSPAGSIVIHREALAAEPLYSLSFIKQLINYIKARPLNLRLSPFSVNKWAANMYSSYFSQWFAGTNLPRVYELQDEVKLSYIAKHID